jgi:hypothetical protein
MSGSEYEATPEVDPQRKYTTGEARKLLGVSFITVKRWIYSKKINAERDSDGRWLISGQEITRLKAESTRAFDDIDLRILELVSTKQVAYLREIQVCLEEEYPHEETYNALKKLVTKGILNTKADTENRWYFSRDKQWNNIADIAKQKTELIRTYVNHPRTYSAENTDYMDYAEWLVETALIRAGYVVVARDTYYFNGRTYRPNSSAGRPTDLDFIAYVRETDTHIGIQIKNRLEHPRFEQVSTLLDICNYLNIRPVLIARILHPGTYDLLKSNKGRALKFKRYFLQPEYPRDKFTETVQMGIPLGVYRWPPRFLVQLLLKLKTAIP